MRPPEGRAGSLVLGTEGGRDQPWETKAEPVSHNTGGVIEVSQGAMEGPTAEEGLVRLAQLVAFSV